MKKVKDVIFFIIEALLLFATGLLAEHFFYYEGILIVIIHTILILANVIFIKRRKNKNKKFYGILITAYILIQVMGILFLVKVDMQKVDLLSYPALLDEMFVSIFWAIITILGPASVIHTIVILSLKNRRLRDDDLTRQADKIIKIWLYSVNGVILFVLGAWNYITHRLNVVETDIFTLPIIIYIIIILINIFYIMKQKVKNESFYTVLISEYIVLQIIGLIYSMNKVPSRGALGGVKIAKILVPITAISCGIIIILKNKMLKNNTNIDKIESKEGEN